MKSKAQIVLSLLLLLATTTFISASPPRETIRFDSDWKFLRGDQSGAEAGAFDDSSWRTLDVPHDWSIEDLPPKPDALPELEAVTGEWSFQKGDDPAWKDPRQSEGALLNERRGETRRPGQWSSE